MLVVARFPSFSHFGKIESYDDLVERVRYIGVKDHVGSVRLVIVKPGRQATLASIISSGSFHFWLCSSVVSVPSFLLIGLAPSFKRSASRPPLSPLS